MTPDTTPDEAPRGVSRRHLLFGGAAAGLGAAGAIGLSYTARGNTSTAETADAKLSGAETIPFYGTHQAGIDTAPQAHAVYYALDLLPGTDAAALRRMMQVLTDDAARLSQGDSALADSEPELAYVPARLTVTFGFGPGLVTRAAGAGAVPSWLGPLPAFSVDRLDPAYGDGDLLMHIAADDPMTVAHTARMLLKDTRSFATLRWTQTGFRRASGSELKGTTMRNLFGQVDGTVNLEPGTADFDQLVWRNTGQAWMAGGTGFVLRRISMDLDKWDKLDRSGREQSVGRTLANGAPLTGVNEHDEADFEAKTPIGFPVIPEFSHMRRARSDNPDERIFRRAYNYDDAPTPGSSVSNSGLLFVSYQADVTTQFVPLQQRLSDLDLLNEWITPVGSAVFAMPPGCTSSGYIGDTLF
ncbi:Dyp-type peroxidase [Frigoribacterium sp. VKM Ac-1396]|uniref:Dyp-type peroxidase n=1 Tax=Frigoribacterium sp. VKM Ac-1396 TaxID=2783821 RepID=UPI00188B0A8E|nr:Dyp-type peroxidase [Frigoribacterium sp. VKM Ac-1396]